MKDVNLTNTEDFTVNLEGLPHNYQANADTGITIESQVKILKNLLSMEKGQKTTNSIIKDFMIYIGREEVKAINKKG